MIRLTMVLLAIVAVAAVDAKTPKEKPVGRRIRPVPVIQRPYRLTVQKTARFPKGKRPEAAKPATNKGLSVTIQPELKKFAGNGPLAFEVILKNDSEKTFMLYGAERLGKGPKLVIANLTTAAQWTLSGTPAKGDGKPSVALAPGKSLKFTAVVEGAVQVVPLPRPFPRPIPKRGLLEAGKKIAAPVDRRRPAIIALATLPCGMGKCRTRLLLEFVADPRERKHKFPHWTGKIATNPVDFEIGKPQPIRPPIGIPPIVGPVTKAQAVKLAHTAAERALNANYKPAEGIRPPHKGVWIDQPEKSGEASQRQGGGWTVRWTHFPKRKGFSYNVTVDVNSAGAAVVREIFAGYSAR